MTKKHTLGDGLIAEEYREKMNQIARALDMIFNDLESGTPRQTGFVLMVFPFGGHEAGRCNYISNGANRKEIVTLMKEMIARFEGQPDIKGRA